MRTAEYVQAALAISSAAGEERAVSVEQQAFEVLTEFRRLVPWSGIEFARWDAARSVHRTLVQVDYPGDVLDHLNGRMFVDDICWPELHRDRRTLSWKDMTFDPGISEFYSNVLVPNGLVEGMYTPLMSSDGQYRGMLTLNTDSWTFPTPEAKAVTDQLVPVLTRLVGRLAGPDAGQAQRTSDQIAVVDASLSFSSELSSGVDVPEHVQLAVGKVLMSGERLARFLVWPESEPQPTHVSLSLGSADGDSMLVVWQEVAPPHALTRRQLDVVAAVADGLSNQEIARRLQVSPRTVTTHVEHILVRLGLSGRSAVVRMALAQGLYLVDVADS